MKGGPSKIATTGGRKGFTLVESLVVVSILAILSAIASGAIAESRRTTALQKLQSDVRTINSAVMMYEVFGGSLASATTPTNVLARVRSRADALSAEQTAGLTGSLVDRRLRPQMQTVSEARSLSPRALWNPASRRFIIATEGSAGVKRFVLDEELAAMPVTEESRTPTMKLATKGNWIWDYEDRPVPGSRSLSPVSLTTPSPSETPLPPHPPGAPPSLLRPPLFSIATGRFPVTAYNLPLELTNPNPAGVSRIVYSLNSGAWVPYGGVPLAIPPSTTVLAYTESIDPSWRNSRQEENRYEADPVRLAMPLISASSPRFDHFEHRSVRIVLQNFNDPAVSILNYSFDGATWQAYEGPFLVDWQDHPDGAGIIAVAVPTSEYYLQSDKALHRIDSSVPLKLTPPVIHLTPDPGDSGIVALTFDNPNPSGSSEIEFRVFPVPSSLGCDLVQGRAAPEDFLTYAAAFPVDALEFSEHYAVIAYSRATGPAWIDSGFAVKYAEDFSSGLRGGHFDVDTSSAIAPINGGSTDAHVHAYDNKFDTTVIDYFNLLDNKLHNITEDVRDPAARFKLIVVNANLTPDARLTINGDPARGGIRGTTYDDTSIESLPVYSLGGVPGTVKLENLAIHFESDAIVNAGLIPTNTGDVRKNVPGKFGEWRNGALTIQAVRVNEDGTPAFTTDPSRSAGGHGPATSGLLWESTVFWHWDGKSYHSPENPYLPRDPSTVRDHVEGGAEDPVCN